MDHFPVKAEFFLRRANHVQPRTLIAGLLHSIEVPQDPNECQLILGHLIIVPKRRFILPESMYGWKIEDLLMENMNIDILKEIGI